MTSLDVTVNSYSELENLVRIGYTGRLVDILNIECDDGELRQGRRFGVRFCRSIPGIRKRRPGRNCLEGV